MVTAQADGTIEFAYFRPSARRVCIAGDFNGWRTDTHLFTCDDRGWWTLRLKLPTGEYRFKYVVDSELWEADFAANGVENDRHGGWNSILRVENEAIEAARELLHVEGRAAEAKARQAA